MLNHELFRRLNGVYRNILPKDNQNTLIRITGRSSWSLARSNLFLPYLWEYGAKLNTYINILFPIQPNHDFSVFTGKTYSTMEYFVKKNQKMTAMPFGVKWSKSWCENFQEREIRLLPALRLFQTVEYLTTITFAISYTIRFFFKREHSLHSWLGK